ncbi:hypothetical protein MMC08_008711, partial [Hypocenomyce scalaris]|nr:hypothetical protein [Hypocenomyce scalaris]
EPRRALLLECGQHGAASSAEIASATCLRLLGRLSMLPSDSEPKLLPVTTTLPNMASRFVEVTTPVTIKREFTFAMPLRGGEVIPKAGTLIGYDGGEAVRTPHDDCVAIMPSQRLWAGLTAVRLGRLIPPPQQIDIGNTKLEGT